MQHITTRKKSYRGGALLAGLAAVAALCLPAGCSDSRPPTVKVQGRITYHGKPLPPSKGQFGMVTFMPVKVAEGLPRRPATGQLQPDGTYVMGTFDPGDGVVPGEYNVAVVSYVDWHIPQNPNDVQALNHPERYASPYESGLKATIPEDADGPLQFDFELVD